MTQQPALVTRLLGEASYAKGAGGAIGYRSSSSVPHALAGGGDYVYRLAGIWQDGAPTGLRRWWANWPPSGNIYGFGFFASSSTFGLAQQSGAKSDSRAIFGAPFALTNGDPFLMVLEQRDQGDGTQLVRGWLNGVPCVVDSVSGTGVDQGDGSARLVDGESDATTEWLWMANDFGDSTASWARFLQVDQDTTDTATEAALATAYLGATGRVGA